MSRFAAGLGRLSLAFVVAAACSVQVGHRAHTTHLAKGAPAPVIRARIDETYGRLPLGFEANVGQVADPDVRFLVRGPRYSALLSPSRVTFHLRAGGMAGTQNQSAAGTGKQASVRMALENADAGAFIAGCEPLPGHVNYLLGADSKRWRTDVPSYSCVKVEAVYPGVDLVYRGSQRELEYDFLVSPGRNPDVISMAFEEAAPSGSAVPLEVDAAGDLLVKTGAGELRQRKPTVYQDVAGVRRTVRGGYVVRGDNRAGFEVGPYDTTRPLVIDPVLVYSTYLGGSGEEQGLTIAVDPAGNAYITGVTGSTDFPQANALQRVAAGGPLDAFVAKLNAAGTALLYSTYLGGKGQDNASAIAVDAAGNAYVAGFTDSADFPTANALQSKNGGRTDAFVFKLNASGSALAYSTYLGGSDSEFGAGIAVGSDGSAYVCGMTSSANFPASAGSLQAANRGGLTDGFLAKLNPAGSQLVYASYLGGSGLDACTSVAVDAAGNAHLSGITSSTNFPTASPFQPGYGGGQFDGFAAKVNPGGSALLYSTYLGGAGVDRASRLALDSVGNAYLTGDTDSPNFPKISPLQPSLGGSLDAFVTKLNPSGLCVYSTYLGGAGIDGGSGIAVDSGGSPHVVGATASSNFPTASPIQTAVDSKLHGFAAKLGPAGTTFFYSTYIAGSGEDIPFSVALDAAGNAYILGQTASVDFPTTTPLQASRAGTGNDLFVVKLAPQSPSIQTTLYFPRLANFVGTGIAQDDTEVTGIAVANLGSANASLTFTAFNKDGSRIGGDYIANPATRLLAPGQQSPVLSSQIFGAGLPLTRTSGWVKLESTLQQVVGFFLDFNSSLTVLDGADVSTSTMTSFVLPEIADEGTAQFHIVNPSSTATALDIELLKSDGTPRIASMRRVVNGNGILAETFDELFPGIRPFGTDYLRVTSSQGVVPFEFLSKAGQYAMGLNGQDATGGATTLYSPQYVLGGGVFRSTLTVINLDSLAGTVTFDLVGDEGTPIGSRRVLPIAPRGKISITDQAFFVNAGAALTQGYVRISSGGGVRLAGDVVFGDPERSRFASALPLVSRLLSSMVFSQLASNETYFTGIAILNPGSARANATIEVFSAKGVRTNFKIEAIPAGQRKSQLLTQYFPELTGQSLVSGYIRLTADRPVASFALFGTNTLSVLSAIPPQLVQ